MGLPLTMLAGIGVGVLVFPGMTVASAFLLSTMLCSTDAALGQRVVTDEAVPVRVRQALDVESGLNDGLAVPFFLVAVAISLAELSNGVTASVVRNMAEQIGWGLVAGLAAGALAGLLVRTADARGWLETQWLQILPCLAALLAYLVALKLGGSGFIAAFVGGMTFGHFSRRHGLTVTRLNEDVGADTRRRDLGRLRSARRRRDVPARHLADRALRGAQSDGRPHGARRDRPRGDAGTASDRRLHGMVRSSRPCLDRVRD